MNSSKKSRIVSESTRNVIYLDAKFLIWKCISSFFAAGGGLNWAVFWCV